MKKFLLIFALAAAVFSGLPLAWGEEAPEAEPVKPPEEAAAGPGDAKPSVPASRKRVLDISIRGTISEKQAMSAFFFQPGEQADLLGLYRLFQRARRDDSIQSVLLRLGPVDAGWGKCEELRAILADFRGSGKKVTVWLPLATNREYFIASAADEILMPPAGLLLTLGLRAEVTFFKGLLDKVGVEAEIVHIGEYKAAGEPYTRNEMSPQFRETLEAMLDDVMASYVEGVSQSRGMTPEQFRQALDQGPYHAAEAQKQKLIDRILYLDEYITQVRETDKMEFVSQSLYEGAGANRPDFSSPFGLLNFLTQMLSPPSLIKSGNPKLALIYAVGPILMEESPGPFGGEEIVTANPLIKAFKEAREDTTVKAVVFRVDSPGGDVITSDLIWRAVDQTNQVKPVIISMSDVAASGGYYIAMPARAIVAYPTTITGSIGVLGGKFNLQKLFGLIGVNVDVVERGAGSGLFSMQHRLTEEETARMQRLLRQTYDLFLEKAAKGRNRKVDELAKAAEGRAWTARRALQLGLVDELGGLAAAIRLAKQHAGLKPDDLLEPLILPRPKTLFELLGGSLEDARSPWRPATPIQFPLPHLNTDLRLAFLLSERYVLLHMPWRFTIR
ncbi:MAG: signal peptide peptidase SppA [Planctomycetes bacterium]|nr:signal peptide peptidase SppA [Planctomycetota bacterium]